MSSLLLLKKPIHFKDWCFCVLTLYHNEKLMIMFGVFCKKVKRVPFSLGFRVRCVGKYYLSIRCYILSILLIFVVCNVRFTIFFFLVILYWDLLSSKYEFTEYQFALFS